MDDSTNTSADRLTHKLEWPPYGDFHAELHWRMDTNRVPDAFMVNGRKASAVDYKTYIDTEAAQMGDWLWPTYDAPSHRWRGHAIEHAKRLTLADLELMDELRGYLPKEVKCLDRGLKTTYKAMFLMEDESAKPTLEIYFPTLSGEVLAAVRAGVDRGLQGVVATTHLRFKEHFQRPRPYQVAYLLGKKFEYEFAKSAVTPSLISGHSLQGLVGRTQAFMDVKPELEGTPEGVESLQQYCVDIGDRRVMAGVHYPSDNLGSWFAGFRLCDHVFGERGQMAKDFMRKAIFDRSIVYHHIQHAAKQKGSPYGPLCARLKKEAHRPAKKTES
jgi:hypothetical protein